MTLIQIHHYRNVRAEYISQIYMDAMVPVTITISPNLKRFAYTCREEGQEGSMVFGAEESHFRYGGRGYVVIDGQESDLYTAITDNTFSFSPNSQRFAYIAQDNKKLFVVTDGKRGASYDNMVKQGPVFSQEGNHLAYAAGIENRWSVIYDDQVLDTFDKINEISFSPDGQHLAYTAEKNGKALLIQDGKCVGKYDLVKFPCFSPDSRRLAYLAVKGDSSFVVLDGVPGPNTDKFLLGAVAIHPNTLDVKMDGKLFFSPDSKHIAYGALIGGKPAAFRDQKEEIRCDNVLGGFVFSPDSEHLLYVAGNDGRQFIVLDGQPQQPYEFLILGQNEVFSPDSSHIAYVATFGDKRCVVVDNQEGEMFDGIRVHTVSFSPDSRRILYIARNDETRFVVLDSMVLSDFPNSTCAVFSPDSLHLAFDTKTKLVHRLMMDTKELFACDIFFTLGGGRILFVSETTIRGLACIMGAVYSVDIDSDK